MTVDLSLYLVTDTRMCGDRGVAATVRMAIAGGVTFVQIRDHDASTRELLDLTRDALAIARPAGVPVVVDDRVDVALAAGADGVHVGQSDLPPIDARRLLGPSAIVGLSVSNLHQVSGAAALPPGTIDYVGVGPFHATDTKPNHPTPLGLNGVRRLLTAATLPSVVIGGVKEDHVADLVAAGTDGVAVVSAICASDDPQASAQEFADQLKAARLEGSR